MKGGGFADGGVTVSFALVSGDGTGAAAASSSGAASARGGGGAAASRAAWAAALGLAGSRGDQQAGHAVHVLAFVYGLGGGGEVLLSRTPFVRFLRLDS